MQQQSMRKRTWASCISCSSTFGRGNNESAAAANKGKSKVAVVRGVPDSFADALAMEKPASPVNLERAREQHAAYVQILRGTFSTTTCSKKLMAIKHRFFFRVKILEVKKLASQCNASFLGSGVQSIFAVPSFRKKSFHAAITFKERNQGTSYISLIHNKPAEFFCREKNCVSSFVRMKNSQMRTREGHNHVAGLVQEVIEIPADNQYPDCPFIEDTAIVIGNQALITRPVCPSFDLCAASLTGYIFPVVAAADDLQRDLM